MIFARPELLTVAFMAALILALSVTSRWRRRRKLADAYGGVSTASRLSGEDLGRYPAARLACLIGAAVVLTFSAAGPARDDGEAVEPPPPVDLVVVVDLSLSMSATDVGEGRIARAKRVIEQLTSAAPFDRIALSLFADWPYGLVPLTDDPNVVDFFAPWVAPELVGRRDQGTSLATAVSQAARTLEARNRPDARQIILLMTDGEAHGQDDAILDSIAASVGQGFVVWTAGIGSPNGAPLMAAGADGLPGETPMRDDAGAPVIAHYDEALLRDMAAVGAGRFFDVSDQAGVRALLRGLQDVSGLVDREAPGPKSPTPWLPLLAFPLLLWDAVSDSGRRRGRAPFKGADHA